MRTASYSTVTLVDDCNNTIGYGYIMFADAELIGPVLVDLKGNPLDTFEWDKIIQNKVILVVYNETIH